MSRGARVGGGAAPFDAVVVPITLEVLKAHPPVSQGCRGSIYLIFDAESNKYQLCIKFPTGSFQVLATEP